MLCDLQDPREGLALGRDEGELKHVGGVGGSGSRTSWGSPKLCLSSWPGLTPTQLPVHTH